MTPLPAGSSRRVRDVVAIVSIAQTQRRRSRGLSAPPLSITILKVVVTAAAGPFSSSSAISIEGCWFAARRSLGGPFILAVILGWTVLLGRTRTGRYIYAIGASPEAARRAGINVAWNPHARLRPLGAHRRPGRDRLRVAPRFDLGRFRRRHLRLYAVAAAVIGGTSLFGGRGKAIHPLIGGVVIGASTTGSGSSDRRRGDRHLLRSRAPGRRHRGFGGEATGGRGRLVPLLIGNTICE